MIDLLGHAAYFTIFVGQFMLTKKSQVGWIVRAVGDVAWMILGFVMGLTCVWMWGVLFLFNDYRGYKAWQDGETHPLP